MAINVIFCKPFKKISDKQKQKQIAFDPLQIMFATRKEEKTIEIIDPSRRLFRQKIDLSSTIQDLKSLVRKRVDDSDPSRFAIQLGEMTIEDDKPVALYEQLRGDYNFLMCNYRIEMNDMNFDTNSKYRFKFSDFDYRDFTMPQTTRISALKRFLVDHKPELPNCQDFNSIALFYKTNDELDDNITLRSIGIAKNEAIIVQSISYQYKVIHPDGVPLIYAMKKRDKVRDLKNKIIQVYMKDDIKIADFSLRIDGEPHLLQDESDLFYERITKDKSIYVIKRNEMRQRSRTLNKPSLEAANRMSLPNQILQKKLCSSSVALAPKPHVHKKRTSISYLDSKGIIETTSTISSIYLFQYMKRINKFKKFKVELPYPCTVSDAKKVLKHSYFASRILNIEEEMIKVKSNTEEQNELNDEDELSLQKLSDTPSYIVEVEFILTYKIKNRKIQKVFNHYPTYSEIHDEIKDDLLKMNPQYTSYSLEYQEQILGHHSHIHIKPNSEITVKIDSPTDTVDSLNLSFKSPGKPTWDTTVEFNNSIADIYNLVKRELNTTNEISLIFQGCILENRNDVFVSDLKTPAKKCIFVYEKLSIKDIVAKTISTSAEET